MRPLFLPFAALVVTVLPAAWLPSYASAQTPTTVESVSVADTFVGTKGPGYSTTFDVPNSNYGGAGALQLSPAGADRGERQSVIRFDLSAAVNTFNATYGAGGWLLSAVTLRLGSNFSVQGSQPNNAIFNPINGGLFDVRWMVNDSWVEGSGNPNGPDTTTPNALTYNNLPTYLAAGDSPITTPTFTPAAANPSQATYNLGLGNAGFVADITGGNLVSLHLLAAAGSTTSYLFNTRTFGEPNNPALFVTAIPEPSSLLLAGAAGMGLVAAVRRRRFWGAVQPGA